VALDDDGTFSVDLLATENTAPLPSGWTWTVGFTGIDGVDTYVFSFELAHADGATQDISELATVEPAASLAAYIPLSQKGANSGVASLDSGGDVPVGQLGNVPLVSGRLLCAPSVYAPGSQTLKSVNSTTLAAFASGTICTGAFTAPASGSVLVTASFQILAATSGHNIMLALAASGTVTPVIGNAATLQAQVAAVLQSVCVQFYVTGLTPGSTYNFDLLGAVTSGDTASIYAFGPTSTSLGSKGAPVVMTVQAV
jgi:hypothetical protein